MDWMVASQKVTHVKSLGTCECKLSGKRVFEDIINSGSWDDTSWVTRGCLQKKGWGRGDRGEEHFIKLEVETGVTRPQAKNT